MRITKNNIHLFVKGATMSCSNNVITGIDYIPEGITHLFCYNNSLETLPKLPNGLIYLSCYNNQLTELPKLPESLKHLYCQNNNLPYIVTIDNFKEHNKLIKRKEILKRICV
tara:strand:+ start:616 stop:951 length:336 start_codon:yes stop_codon:yes gene_type:complete